MLENSGGLEYHGEPLRETALYYPYMKVPKSPWFTQVLLYWDDVATIVPDAYRDASSREARAYVETGLLRRMSPDDAVRGLRGDQFVSTFLQTITPWDSAETPSFTRIHAGKMSAGLFEELAAMGLARRADDLQGIWYRVEKSTAGAFMAYLAGVMSGLTPGLTPVTDSASHVAALAAAGRSQKQKLQALRYSAITEALPTPLGPVTAYDLVEFKDKNRDALKRCRDYLDSELLSLTRVSDDDELAERELAGKLDGFRTEAEELQNELAARMRERGWAGVARASFGAIAAAGLSSASALADGGSALVTGLALGSSVCSLIDPARDFLRRRASPESASPLLYAALTAKLA